LMFAD
jgi:hypothetical protein